MKQVIALSIVTVMLSTAAVADMTTGLPVEITCANQSSCAKGALEIPHGVKDGGTQYLLAGKALFPGMAPANLKGHLFSLGFIHSGKAGGTITLKNADGSIDLNMEGPEQTGFSPLPETMRYVIQNGTKKYADMNGKGRIDLKLSYGKRESVAYSTNGSFELTFYPDKK